jgi:hypothetical protein
MGDLFIDENVEQWLGASIRGRKTRKVPIVINNQNRCFAHAGYCSSDYAAGWCGKYVF